MTKLRLDKLETRDLDLSWDGFVTGFFIVLFVLIGLFGCFSIGYECARQSSPVAPEAQHEAP